ncbi:VOC family protein [Xylanimonas ulmi]|uniref:Putative 3-demethylubiquinone-9 3-methyltransferase (Glyoxalase superfamily) n=1 Tax=Xylanimonas ulmi TaxID=228973 RepID=A0A4Q7M6X3_9MICO|nr:VOC family protein [Xylanibacterium ulmi]RZS63261.1 putative 3-demethylubiquinone-9 3-methyltransferase (glyoxalase superfamily) [Xylanibacterium ulmi]
MGIVKPHLWFASGAEQAAEFYASVIPNSRVTHIETAPAGVPDVEEGAPFVVDLDLDGMPVQLLNAGPAFTLDEAFSFVVECEDQAQVDRYWDALTADGGTPGQCGWLTDRFGVSWQVVPQQLSALMSGASPEATQRTLAAMFAMGKLDIAALEAAARGDT